MDAISSVAAMIADRWSPTMVAARNRQIGDGQPVQESFKPTCLSLAGSVGVGVMIRLSGGWHNTDSSNLPMSRTPFSVSACAIGLLLYKKRGGLSCGYF